MRNLLKFLVLAALPLFAYPLTAYSGVAHTDDLGGAATIGNCYDLSLGGEFVTFANSDIRQYHFTGKCVSYDYDIKNEERDDKIRSATITAVYNRTTGNASETLTLSGVGATNVFNWQCSNDPWLFSGATCTCLTTTAVPQYCQGHPPLGSPTGPPPWSLPLHAPLTKPGASAVTPFVTAFLNEKARPLIQIPAEGQSYPAGNLTVIVQYKPLRSPSFYSNWEIAYTYPPAASIVVFEWQRWNPAPGGQGGSWVTIALLANMDLDSFGPTIDTSTKEGLWRVKARHASAGWPWSDPWVKFWIGDKVDYTKPMAAIQLPTQNQIHVEGGPGLYKVDFLVFYQGQQSPKQDPSAQSLAGQSAQAEASASALGGGSNPFEVEVQLDWYQTGQNGQFGYGVIAPIVFVKTANLTFTQYLNPGAWRVRARKNGLTGAGVNYPWTAWREFSTGLPIFLLEVLAGVAGGQSGARFDAEIAKKVIKALGGQGMRRLDTETRNKLIEALNRDHIETLDAATAEKLVAALQGKVQVGGVAMAAKPVVASDLGGSLVPPLEEQPRGASGGSVQPALATSALKPMDKPPALKVANIMVTGKAAAGQPVNLMVTLKNTSDKPIEANLKGLKIACVAPAGATCTIQKTRGFMGLTLQPGQTRALKLTVMPSTGGPYKVSIAPHNAPASSGREISVAVAQAPVSSKTRRTAPKLMIVPKSPLRQ